MWATPWATRRDRKTHFVLTSAVLAPGATGFGPAVEVDGNDIGDGSAAYPSLAMTPGGSAYVAYRVVTNPLDVNAPAIGVQPMRPGDELVDVRAARFNGMTWSSVGNVNRLRNQVTMRRPTAANAPAIGVNRRGDAAVVTWQEPTIDGVARIWARRLFGTTQGVVLPVSPTALDGTPVGADADAPAVAVSSLSEARFAFRLQGGLGSPTGSSQLLGNGLPPLTDDAAGRLVGLARLDAAAAIGPPSVALDDDGYFRVGYSADGGARLVTGDPGAISAPTTLQAGASDPVLVTRDPQQGGVTAWGGTDDGGRPVVKVRQEFDDGQWQIAHLTAPVSGDINGLSLGRAPGGDALVAFRQGRPSARGSSPRSPPRDRRRSSPTCLTAGSARRRPASAGTPRRACSATSRTRSCSTAFQPSEVCAAGTTGSTRAGSATAGTASRSSPATRGSADREPRGDVARRRQPADGRRAPSRSSRRGRDGERRRLGRADGVDGDLVRRPHGRRARPQASDAQIRACRAVRGDRPQPRQSRQRAHMARAGAGAMSARRAHPGPRHGALGRSLRTASALLVCGGAALLAPSAEAGFTPSALVSGSQQIGADYAFDPAFAADGRYVVYGGSQGTTAGVYRKDLATGTLELVAAGDAGAPSVSADGRWVAFTSSARLGSADDHAGACTSVYVRDMSLPATDPAAYLLASARDGSDAGLTYADAGTPGCPGGGADAAARGAISADGRKVAFTVIGASDLLGAAGDTTTAEAQIAVRDLAMRTTQLVSQTRESLGGVPAAVDGGAALSSSKRVEARNRPVARSSATISADGTTVAWMGIQIPQQAPIGDRFTRQPPGTGPRWYAEPLWRRIADGPTAPTRRIVGGSDDPEACPSCDGPLIADFAPDLPPPDGPDPLAGSFIFVPSLGGGSLQNASTIEAATPRMSADGRRVAVLSTQPGHEERQAAGSGGSIAATANAFVVDMAPGLTRTQALTRLTRWASIRFGQGNENVSGPVTSVAISPDGTRVAFTTNRIVFTQSPPGLVTPPLSQPRRPSCTRSTWPPERSRSRRPGTTGRRPTAISQLRHMPATAAPSRSPGPPRTSSTAPSTAATTPPSSSSPRRPARRSPASRRCRLRRCRTPRGPAGC